MRKHVTFLMILLLCLWPACPAAAAESVPTPPDIASKHAILAQAGTGRILYEKAADEKAYPASTTKIMTALLAIEQLDPTATLTASESAVQIDRDGSNMGILRDEVLTVEQLLYGLLVHSANDAANVLAEAVAGDISQFVDRMNVRAAELGMTNTHFVNTHGYHDSEHYTTARDLLTLSMHAMENPLFAKIVSTAQYEIPPTNKYTETRYLSNNNALINPMRDHRYRYSAARGIKTGHTQDAGYCLTSYAEKDGRRFFCVTLNAPIEDGENHSFLDTIALLDYGFDKFKLESISDVNEIVATHEVRYAKGGEQVVLSAKEPFEVLLPKGYSKEKLTTEMYVEENITAPVAKGDVLGRAEYFYDGISLGAIDLTAVKPIKKSYLRMIFFTLFDLIFNVWVMTPLAVIVLILIVRALRESRRQRIARERRRQQVRRDFYR
ncbi:MAG: D-alanyl-D-alanine carboxypeptidase [Ruminococcaceae bacterium]|nr:D-alanyl-D-alanine carboxypeptidase [Oscillospiraceae bacterium]